MNDGDYTACQDSIDNEGYDNEGYDNEGYDDDPYYDDPTAGTEEDRW